MDGPIIRKWIYGGPWDIWIRYADFVNTLVKENNLRPLTAEVLRGGKALAESEAPMMRPRPFPGGIRAAHLHLGEDIFLVKEEQWGRFTEKVMGDLGKRMKAAKNIRFGELMDVADAVEGLS
jgi:hypothetical protein